MKLVNWIWMFSVSLLAFTPELNAESVDIFTSNIPQHTFATGDIQTALQAKGHQVTSKDLATLTNPSSTTRIVIATKSETNILNLLQASNGSTYSSPGEQAYVIRTTGTSLKTYWIIGGDVNGAMYGAFQLVENIKNGDWGSEINSEESPYILNRGVKFNIPFDARSPTYYGSGFSTKDFLGTAFQNAVKDVWDINFWKDFFDEMARHRYNAIQMWSLHPFTSMIKLADYPNVALQDVQGFNGYSKKMSIDEKIKFWQDVMVLAKNRGMQFHFMIWNLFTYGATGKYGIDNNPATAATVPYMRKCIYEFFKTYPDLTGFGVTAGENMGTLTNDEEATWMWSTFGEGILQYAKENPNRKIVFIHRYHGSGADAVTKNFKKLMDQTNVRFDFSFKYAVAHIYSTTSPAWITTDYGDVPQQLGNLGLKTWLNLRNDSFYYLHWGDPDFVREYIANFPDKDKYIQGFVTGSDGYVPTRTFFAKDEWAKGGMEINRMWYMHMLWGRLGYNPKLSNAALQKMLAVKYPTAPGNLFSAWSNASKGIPKMTELIQGTWKADWNWWPEACESRSDGLLTIDQFLTAEPPPGSNMCSLKNTADGKCGTLKSALKVADEIEATSSTALNQLGLTGSTTGGELQTNLSNLRAMSYLGLYFSEKIRGAVQKSTGKTSEAQKSMGNANCHWKSYSGLMNVMYTGMDMQRTKALTNWLSLDADVYKEFTALGGTGQPNCKNLITSISPLHPTTIIPSIGTLTRSGLHLSFPGAGILEIQINSVVGKKVFSTRKNAYSPGNQFIPFPQHLVKGIYWVTLTFEGAKYSNKRMVL